MAIKYHALIVHNMLRAICGKNTDSWVFSGQNGAKSSNYFIICISEE